MVEWSIPRNISELRGVLGLKGYYRRFFKDYEVLAVPLAQLLQKNAFVWNETATEAFDKLKRAMVTISVLALPKFSKTFIIERDASSFGLGVVLMQEDRPIAYFSHC